MRGDDLFRFGSVLFDNPRFRLDDPRALDLFFGEKALRGRVVNARTALTVSPWFRGINLVCNAVAKLPLGTFRKIKGGGRQFDPTHPWSRAFRRKIGPYDTPFTWKRYMTQSVKVRGNGYSYIDRVNVRLLKLHPEEVEPVIQTNQDVGEERLFYVWRPASKKPEVFHADEILHFRGLTDDGGIIGLSVVDLAKHSLGLAMAAREHQSIALKNGARPSIILTFPGVLKETTKTNIANHWQRMNSGERAGATAVLDRKMDVKTIGFNAQETQLIETQKFSLVDIAGFIDIPPHKLGDATRAGYNGLEQENLAMLGDSLDPLLVNFEEEMADKLMTEDEKDQDELEMIFDRSKLMATDRAGKVAFWNKALGGAPFAKVSEARADCDMNHDPDTDYIPQPVNIVTPDDDDPEKNAPPSAPRGNVNQAQVRIATEAALLQSVSRVLRRYSKTAANRATSAKSMTDLAASIADNAATISDELLPTWTAATTARGDWASPADKLAGTILATVQNALVEFSAAVGTAAPFSDERKIAALACCSKIENAAQSLVEAALGGA